MKGKKLPQTKNENGNEVSDEDEAADMDDEEVKKKTKNKVSCEGVCGSKHVY